MWVILPMPRAVTLALAVVLLARARVVRGTPYAFSGIKKCKPNLNLVALTYGECQTLAEVGELVFGSWHKSDRPAGCTTTETSTSSPITFNSHTSGAVHADFDVYCYCADGTTYDEGSCIDSAEGSAEACHLAACNPEQLSNAYAAATGASECSSSPGHASVEGGCETNGCDSAEIETAWRAREAACSNENE